MRPNTRAGVYAAALSCSFWSQYAPKEQLTRRLDPEDLFQRRDCDLELLGRGLLSRPVALDFPPGGMEGLGQRVAVVAVAPGEHLDRERGDAEGDAGAATSSTARGAPPRATPPRAAALGLSPSRSSRTVPPAESSIIGTSRL